MSLVTWDPFKEMDSLFNRYFQRQNREQSGWLPAVDIDEDDNAFHLAFEVPGIAKENIEVAVHQGVLTVSGERSREEKGQNHRSERSYGKFSRSFTLPDNIDAGSIEARFDSGMLILALPKSKQIQEPKRIEVH
ncbi:Hsp20/alpha crystallin family protein [Gallaecimonas mangrovi]|uniref:Hsp20/alpha crystallin family protein n=1 Tax=Gallaecimonas mangrovi TaxID=2291597 RepID=UPI000E20A926|nr:Hsp20/alpha crystallin family protein [Gallaecimonas mangrovi]